MSVGDSTTTFTIGVDKPIADGTATVNYVLHHSSAGDYRLKLRYDSNGQVAVWLTKKVGSTETLLKDAGTLAGFTQTAGATLQVKVDSVTTGGSTTLRTKVWPTGTDEPTAWKATVTDSEAALQAAGQIALTAYANSSVHQRTPRLQLRRPQGQLTAWCSPIPAKGRGATGSWTPLAGMSSDES